MGFIRTRRQNNGGGGGQTLVWAMDRLEQSDPFSSGFTIPLSQTPVDEDSIIVYFQTIPLDTDDYNYDSINNEIVILFGADPPVDYPPTGTCVFRIQYPYAI